MAGAAGDGGDMVAHMLSWIYSCSAEFLAEGGFTLNMQVIMLGEQQVSSKSVVL